MRIPAFLTAAMAATLVSIPSAQATVRLANDPGGLIAAYHQRFLHVRASGERVVIDGSCLSACTLAIGLVPREQICATPRAVLGFHAAWQPTPFGKQMSPPATQRMWEVYPAEVKGWITRHGGLTPRMIFLKGAELETMVPACGEAETAAMANIPNKSMQHRRPGRSVMAMRHGPPRGIFAVRRMQ